MSTTSSLDADAAAPAHRRKHGTRTMAVALAAALHLGIGAAILSVRTPILSALPQPPDLMISLAAKPAAPLLSQPPPAPRPGRRPHPAGGGAPAAPHPTRVHQVALADPPVLSPFAPTLTPADGPPVLTAGPPVPVVGFAGAGAGVGSGAGPGAGGRNGEGGNGLESRRLRLVDWSQWLHRPTLQEVAAYYPARAGKMSMDGVALLACFIAADDKPPRCQVLDEHPRNMGFGVAALEMSHLFRLSPIRVDGRVAKDAGVVIPVRFSGRLSRETPSVSSPAPPPTITDASQ